MIEEGDDVRGEGRREVVGILQKHGPLNHDELIEKCELIEDSKQLSNVLYSLRIGKQIVKLDDGRWSLAGAKVSAVAESGRDIARKVAEKIAAQRRDPSPPPAPAGDDALQKVLEKAVEDAQAAIDEYVAHIGDRQILDPLRAARDQARLALENYRRGRDAGA